MKLPSWGIPALVIAYLAVRILLGARFRKTAPPVPGKTWFQTVPVWIRAFWVALALAMVVLVFWKPRGPGSAAARNPHAPGTGGLSFTMTDAEILRALQLDPQVMARKVVQGPDGEEDDYRDATHWVMITRSADILSVSRLEPRDQAQTFVVHRP